MVLLKHSPELQVRADRLRPHQKAIFEYFFATNDELYIYFLRYNGPEINRGLICLQQNSSQNNFFEVCLRMSYQNFKVAIYCTIHELRRINNFTEFEEKFKFIEDHMDCS